MIDCAVLVWTEEEDWETVTADTTGFVGATRCILGMRDWDCACFHGRSRARRAARRAAMSDEEFTTEDIFAAVRQSMLTAC